MMVGAHNPDKGDATYTYNGFRNRVAKLENMHRTSYVLDMTLPYDNLLMTKNTQENQTTQPQHFIWGNSLLSSTGDDPAQNFHYLHDHLGSPIRLLGSDNYDRIMSYDEFGVPEVVAGTAETLQSSQYANPSQEPSFHNPFGFTGYQTDNISGLLYAQARYYNPNEARFTAQDIVRDGLNWYTYCRANPVRLVDKNGLWPKDTHEEITRYTFDERGIGLPDYIVDRLARYVRTADEESILGPFPGGTYGIHFNANSSGQEDSRIMFSNQLLDAAINIANGTGNPLSSLIPYDVMSRAINNANLGINIDEIASDIMQSGATIITVSLFEGSHPISNLITRGVHYAVNHSRAGTQMREDRAVMQAVYYAMNCLQVGAYVREELALLHIGIGLHALQDIDAHGQIGANSPVNHGHAFRTVFSYINRAANPDSLDYDWRDRSQTRFQSTNLNRVHENPRSVSSINRSREYLNQFMSGLVDPNFSGISSLHCPACVDSAPAMRGGRGRGSLGTGTPSSDGSRGGGSAF